MATVNPPQPEPRPPAVKDATDADRRKAAEEAATRHADKTADAQLDPAYAAHLAAMTPEPVYHLPDQANTNPGVQGWVFRPHQEKNPGAGELAKDRERDTLSKKLSLEKEARGRRWAAYREAAQARGENLPEHLGPQRLRMHVDITAHSLIEEDKLAAVAQAADALVAALHEAGIDHKADVSGIPVS